MLNPVRPKPGFSFLGQKYAAEYERDMNHASVKETYPIGTTIYHASSETTGKVINYHVEGSFIFLMVETAEGDTREFCHTTVIPR